MAWRKSIVRYDKIFVTLLGLLFGIIGLVAVYYAATSSTETRSKAAEPERKYKQWLYPTKYPTAYATPFPPRPTYYLTPTPQTCYTACNRFTNECTTTCPSPSTGPSYLGPPETSQ